MSGPAGPTYEVGASTLTQANAWIVLMPLLTATGGEANHPPSVADYRLRVYLQTALPTASDVPDIDVSAGNISALQSVGIAAPVNGPAYLGGLLAYSYPAWQFHTPAVAYNRYCPSNDSSRFPLGLSPPFAQRLFNQNVYPVASAYLGADSAYTRDETT